MCGSRIQQKKEPCSPNPSKKCCRTESDRSRKKPTNPANPLKPASTSQKKTTVPAPPPQRKTPSALHVHLFRFLPAAVFLHSPLSAISSSLDLIPLPLPPPPEAAASPISASICSSVLPCRSASISRLTLRMGVRKHLFFFGGGGGV